MLLLVEHLGGEELASGPGFGTWAAIGSFPATTGS